MTEIKFNAGDEVFWLSPNGFRKGWVKKVTFHEEVIGKGVNKKLNYYCTCDTYNPTYEGDKVDEDRLFRSYDALVKFYEINPL